MAYWAMYAKVLPSYLASDILIFHSNYIFFHIFKKNYDFSLNSIQNNSTFTIKYPPSHPTPHLHHYDYYGEQLAAREEDWPLCQTSPANSNQPQNHQRTHDQPQNHKRTHVQPQIHH